MSCVVLITTIMTTTTTTAAVNVIGWLVYVLSLYIDDLQLV